jgi:tRNA(Ile)-lysidine synthetase-like protein
VGQPPLALQATHFAALQRLCATSDGTRTLDLPAGVRVERRYDRLRFLAHSDPDPGDLEIVVAQPGNYPFLNWSVQVGQSCFSRAQGAPLYLRNFRAGDRLVLAVGHQKLKQRFIDRKVPREQRRRLPILVQRGSPIALEPSGADEILWVPDLFQTTGVEVRLTGGGAVQ